MVGLENGSALFVVAYPVAWKVEVVNDEIHRDFEYVRSERVLTSSGTAHICNTLAFPGELRGYIGT